MSIGILDYDAITTPRYFKFNLEAMKLASYYKKNNYITKLILDLDDIDRFDTIYLRKDIKNLRFPSELIAEEKVKYGGLAFTNNIYRPLDIEIENTAPDTTLYNYYIIKYQSKFSKKKFARLNNLPNYSHIRLSSDLKTCNLNIDKSLKKNYTGIEVYDNCLPNLDGSAELLKEISRYGRIEPIHPIKVTNREQLDFWGNLDFFADKTFLNIGFKVNTKEFKDICSRKYKNNIGFIFGELTSSNENFICDLKSILKKILYCKANKNSQIKFYKNKEVVGTEYGKIYSVVEDYANSYRVDYSFLDRAKMKSGIQYERLKKMQEKDKELYSLFNTIPLKVRNCGGILVI